MVPTTLALQPDNVSGFQQTCGVAETPHGRRSAGDAGSAVAWSASV